MTLSSSAHSNELAAAAHPPKRGPSLPAPFDRNEMKMMRGIVIVVFLIIYLEFMIPYPVGDAYSDIDFAPAEVSW